MESIIGVVVNATAQFGILIIHTVVNNNNNIIAATTVRVVVVVEVNTAVLIRFIVNVVKCDKLIKILCIFDVW